MTAMMKAALCERYGPPEVFRIGEVRQPQPADREVRIAVHTTTVTSACTMMRRGDTAMARLVLGLTRPRRRYQVMGMEVAGVVDLVGRGVTRFQPGDRVFGFTGFSAGGYAQYVCLPEAGSLARTPASLTDDEACTLVDGPTTALYFLRERAGLRAGERVAIVGASGSVGTAAVQLARHLGAEVTAICSARNHALVRSLGAHHVVDYTREDFAARSERYDLIFDTVGKRTFKSVRRCLTERGKFATTVGGPLAFARNTWSRIFGKQRFVFGMSVDKKSSLEEVAALVERGILKPVIDRRLPLEALSDAHRYVESGHKCGNVVIEVKGR